MKNFIQREKKLSWVEPAAGVVCFPRVEDGLSGDTLARLLREEYDTAVIPGSFFSDSQHFRLGFDLDFEILSSALENIRQVLMKY